MDFCNYVIFFHDGALDNIIHVKDEVAFEMTTMVLTPDQNVDGVELDEDGCLSGTLRLKGLRSILIGAEPCGGQLTFNHDSGEILDFKIRGNEIELGILWTDYSALPTDPVQYSRIIAEADEIIWEDANNPITLTLTGTYT